MNFDGASLHESGKRNVHLDQVLRQLHQEIQLLKRGSGTQGVDPDKQHKVSVAPPRAGLAVMPAQGGGQFAIAISNPEFGLKKGQNPLRTALIHQVEYSPDPSFRTSVTKFPKGPQTYFTVKVAPGTKLHFRSRSSVDGKNWSAHTLSGPVTA